MWIAITNKNMEYTYPLVLQTMDCQYIYDKQTGNNQTAINIREGSDLAVLDSLARMSGNRYRYMLYMNNMITLVDETTNESEKGD